MRIGWKLLGAAAAGSLTSWLLFVTIYRPTEHDYLITTTSYYFKRMSQSENSAAASYSDCRVEPADASERRMGVTMFGQCRSETDTEAFYFFVALSPTAKFLYSDFEVRSAKD